MVAAVALQAEYPFYTDFATRKLQGSPFSDVDTTMYEQDDYVDPFQPPIGASSLGVGQVDVDAIDGMMLQHVTMTYAPAGAAYDPQQTYGTETPDSAYGSYPVPQFPQSWLPMEPMTTEPVALDHDQQQLYAIPRSNSATLSPIPALQPSFSKSSSEGVSGASVSDDRSPPKTEADEKKKERRERRRAQNRVAQRLFRARREVSLKESSARLENLEDEVGRLHNSKEGMSETILTLREEVQRLRRENNSLKTRLSEVVDQELDVLQVSAPSIFVDSDNETTEVATADSGSKRGKSTRVSDASSSSGPSARHTRNKKQRTAGLKQIESEATNTANVIESKFI